MRVRAVCLSTNRPTRALVGDRRGGVLLETAIMLVVSLVSAAQVAALMGATLQQDFAPVSAVVAALNGG